MMHNGIEFLEGSNALICANAIYRVRTNFNNCETAVYQFRSGPHGTYVDEVEEQHESGRRWWKVTKQHRIEGDDMTAFLPPEQFGKMSMRDFILALTYWGEGHDAGYKDGEGRGFQRGRAYEKNQK